METFTCAYHRCQQPFTRYYVNQRFCSDVCRSRANTEERTGKRIVKLRVHEYESIDNDDPVSEYERPKTYGDCLPGGMNPPLAVDHHGLPVERQCPYFGCRYHLLNDQYLRPDRRSFRVINLEEYENTCAIDVANWGGLTLEAVGGIEKMTRERIRQVEERAKAHYQKRAQIIARKLGISVDDLLPWRDTTASKDSASGHSGFSR